MSDLPRSFKRTLLGEVWLLLALFLFGILILPVTIYFVGQLVFGEYGGTGFADFYGRLHYQLRTGDPVSWYLVLSPYLGWQLFRLTVFAFRRSRERMSLKGDSN